MPQKDKTASGGGPEDVESLLSRLTYHWVLRSLRAYSNGKVAIPSAPSTMDPQHLLTRFNNSWSQALNKKHPLARALIHTFARDLGLVSSLRLAVYAIDVAVPIVVARMLRELCTNPSTLSIWRAASVLFLYAGLSFVSTVTEQNQIDLQDKAKLKIRTMLTAALHQTALASRGSRDVEEARRLGTDMYSCGIRSTHQLASHIVSLAGAIWLPVRVTAGLYVFYRQVGWAVIPGVAAVLLYLPLRRLLVLQSTAAQTQADAASSQRVGLVTQLITHIIPLRMLGWDRLLENRIQRLRELDELKYTAAASIASCLLSFARTACRTGGPLVSLFIYSMYCYLRSSGTSSHGGGPLGSPQFVTSDQVYIVQAILRELFPLLIDVPHAFDSWWAAQRPYKHIQALLQIRPDSVNNAPTLASKSLIAVHVSDSIFAWTMSSLDTLAVPKLEIKQGELVAVVGKVGSGKSSLLWALLGEMTQTAGSEMFVDRNTLQTAYVSQTPWLMNSTIRESILFGLTYDPLWYAQVVDSCELLSDLDRMAAGDQTVVGTGGMALSGGQRVRVALARAVYSRPGLVFLDDFLVSVDTHVARRIIDRVLLSPAGLLASAARVIVTQSPAVLSAAHGVCIVDKGRVSQPRPLSELLDDAGTDFCAVAGISTVSSLLLPAKPVQSLLATPPNSGSLAFSSLGDETVETAAATTTTTTIQTTPKPAATTNRRHIEYLVPVRYMLRLCGGLAVALHCLTVAAQCLASRQAQLWLAKPIPLVFSAAAGDDGTTHALSPANTGSYNGWHHTAWHFIACVAWWAADITLELGGQWWTNVVWQRSMFVKSHNELLASILAAPLSFFASTPLGHVLLLFTDSQRDVDTHMPQRLANVATFLVKLSFESWVILTFHPALVIAVVAVILAMRYIVTTSRHPLAAFLAAQTDSRPLIDEQYQEALDGAATIRAFGAHSFAERRLFARLTAFVSAQRAGDCTETWIDMSMSLLRGFVTTTAFGIALIGAATSNGLAVDPAYMSLVYWSITFHLARIQHLIRHSHALHASLDCATRYIKYTTIKPESHIDTARLELEIPDAWPSTGSIVFDRVCARYTRHYGNYGNEDDADKSLTTAAAAETQPLKHQNSSRSSGLALQDMSFSICSGQHVGIVGRTGAGKTSIAMALLGLLNPESGSIRIDSLDISMISPDKLRGRLSVVPQAPVVLPGSVRYNIDPKSEHSDDEVRKVLDAVGLSPDATLCLLDDNVPETWSTGQRQLLCIARAMLKHTNILILDEATAAVDSQASKRLHELIRRTFAQCTVITIAHRLETVYDCDQVLVVDDGRICESGTPASLLAQPGTHFARMAQQKK